MKFFIDTANLDEIGEAASLGVLDGVTTNPTLLAREVERSGLDPKEILHQVCELVNGPVSAEVTHLDMEGMIQDGKELSRVHSNIVIKIPITEDGLRAIKTLEAENVRVNTTLVFSTNQAILAAKAGTSFVSPFIGRLDDIGHVGMDLVRDVVQIFLEYGFKSEVIVASVRHPLHVVDAALAGAHIVTIPFKVIKQMVRHPLTDIGIERFARDWERAFPRKE
jgi:transaldolase